jgi:hypothetical protein
LTRYFRVKAKGGPLFSDSSWSKTVSVAPRKAPLSRLVNPALTLTPKNPALSTPWGTSFDNLLGNVGDKPSPARFTRLAAPHLSRAEPRSLLEVGNRSFSWTSVADAVAYVLERSADHLFSEPVRLYKGPDTRFLEQLPGADKWLDGYYRVRAEGGPTTLDSPWSDVVEVRPLKLT